METTPFSRLELAVMLAVPLGWERGSGHRWEPRFHRSVGDVSHPHTAVRPVDIQTSDVCATLGTAVFSNDVPPPDLADIIGRIAPRPVLLMNGVGGEERNQVFHKAAGGPAELWRVPGGPHLGGIDAQPEEYERRVTDFFDRALLAGPR
jgi:hypothetical protein